jgi:prefoldin alpha subunit
MSSSSSSTTASSGQANAQKVIKLEQIGLEQLLQLKEQLTQDLNMFLNSYNGLQGLIQKFEYSRAIIKEMIKEENKDAEMLMQITNYLYIPGQIKENKKFLIEIGTGYYAEYEGEKAVAYYERKVEFTKQSSDKAKKEMDEKREFIGKVNVMIQKKALEKQAAQNAPAATSSSK